MEKLSRFNWMPFEEAREFVRSLKLKRQEGIEDTLERKNHIIYLLLLLEYIKDSGWISYPDFLGYKSI